MHDDGARPRRLGVYGARTRINGTYATEWTDAGVASAYPTVWSEVERAGKRAIGNSVPPNYQFNIPPVRETSNQIQSFIQSEFQTIDQELQNGDWDYLQCFTFGLNLVQQAYGNDRDPTRVSHEPDAVRDAYRALDDAIGGVLERLDDETVILVVSAHGARRCDGGFGINEWLIRENLLKLHSYPSESTAIERLDVDWEHTLCWSDSGECAEVFLNVKGREPRGAVAPEDYQRVRNDVKARLEATADAAGRPLGTRVFTPEEIYTSVNGNAPDLIVEFGGLSWWAAGKVGDSTIHLPGEGCNVARQGAFILAGPSVAPVGAVEGAHLLGVAPTLLGLGGYDVPASMRGRAPLFEGSAINDSEYTADDEAIINERLRGLGYIG